MPERIAVRAVRAQAVATAAAVATVAVASQVPPDLWAIDGTPAEAATVAYLGALTWLAAQPARRAAHAVTMSFGVVWWLGRGGGFLNIVTDGRPDLWGAVVERWWAAFTVVTLHVLFGLVAETATPPLPESRGDTTTTKEA